MAEHYHILLKSIQADQASTKSLGVTLSHDKHSVFIFLFVNISIAYLSLDYQR